MSRYVCDRCRLGKRRPEDCACLINPYRTACLAILAEMPNYRARRVGKAIIACLACFAAVVGVAVFFSTHSIRIFVSERRAPVSVQPQAASSFGAWAVAHPVISEPTTVHVNVCTHGTLDDYEALMPLDLSGDITGEPQCAKDWK